MERNKREIILDFTSLLDIIMMLLFFFVIFAQLDSNQAIENAESKANEQIQQAHEAQAEAEEQFLKAENELKEAENIRADAEHALNEIKQSNERNGANIEGILDFDNGINLKLFLQYENNNWNMKVKSGKERIGVIENIREREADDIAEELSAMLVETGYTNDLCILCDLIYKANEPGSNKSINNVENSIDILKNDYKYFYCSSTDTSDF